MNKCLHIVTLDVPFPADYGGAIDMYTRLLALKRAGFTIHLHCFEYGRGKMPEAEELKLADRVYYYGRRTGVFSQLSSKPYIVKSRENDQLLKRLLSDSWPVLLEGQHCSGIAHALKMAEKRVLVRMHNIEWQYYSNLAKSANRFLDRFYFQVEARKLKRDEQALRDIPLACITEADAIHYKNLGFEVHWVPPVVLRSSYESKPGEYYLFHGNLSVAENEEAVRIIIAENQRTPFSAHVIIAGKNPSALLSKQIEDAGFELQADPNTADMDALIAGARVHLLITRKVAGIKMKLLQSLGSQGHCIATKEMVENTGLAELCTIWEEDQTLAACCNLAQQDGFTLQKRQEILESTFGAASYVKQIEKLLFA